MPTANYDIPTIDPQGKINIAADVNAALNAIDTAIAGKAQTDHASAEETYGIGTATEYGHLKITDSLAYSNDAIALKASAVRPFIFYKGLEMVAFGDSFMDPTAPNAVNGYLPTTIANVLGMTLHNFAVAGAGFARTGNLISTQMATAQTDLTATQKTNTGLVLIYAGYNDIANNVEQNSVNTGIVNACQTARSMFPNATILLAPYNWGFGELTDLVNNQIATSIWSIKRQIYPYGVITADNARFWILGNRGSFQNEVHPSQLGYNAIAEHMINIILGGSDDTMIGTTYATVNNLGTLTATFKNGLISVQGYFQLSSALNTGQQVALSKNDWPLLAPPHDIVTPVIDYSTSSVVGIAVLRTNMDDNAGSISVRANTNMAANKNYWIVPVSYFTRGASWD